MKWTDINDIAIELAEAHPDVDPTRVNFVDLARWIISSAVWTSPMLVRALICLINASLPRSSSFSRAVPRSASVVVARL